MGIITTGSFAKALYPGVAAWYGRDYSEAPPGWSTIFEKKTSRRAFEEDVSISSFPLIPVKGEGDAVTYATEEQGFITRYTHIDYGLGFVITRNMVDDDLYDVVGERRAKALSFSVRQTYEVVHWNILNRGFNTSYTYGDGKALCVNDHPNIAGGTWSNTGTAADFSEAALEQAIIDIAKWKNDAGLQIDVRPQQLIIPVDLQFDAERVLGSNLRVGTANNDLNALKSLGKLPKGYMTSVYLSDPDAWFILTDVPNGLIHRERRAPEFTMDNDWDTENAKFKTTFRFSCGCTDQRAIYGNPGA